MSDGSCNYEDLCLELIDDKPWGVVIEVVVAIYSFVGIAVVADEHLAPALETLCHRLQLPEDVAGASFLALGSAAPEIIIAAVSTVKSILSTDQGEEVNEEAAFATSLGVGSILGSGMLAFTLIPGLCAMAVPRPMLLKRRPLVRDAVFYLLSLGPLYKVLEQGYASWLDSVAMVGLYAVYIGLTAIAPWLREWWRKRLGKEPRSSPMERGEVGLEECISPRDRTVPGGFQTQAQAAAAEEEGEEEEEEEAGPIQKALFVPFQPMASLVKLTCPECEIDSETEGLYAVTLVFAFTWLAAFSTALSAAITRWGVLLNVPGTFMGMFVIAVGAQIPDTVQALAVARRGLGSMAVASAVGSQVMNVLIGLGMPWLLSTSAGMPITLADKAQLTMSARRPRARPCPASPGAPRRAPP